MVNKTKIVVTGVGPLSSIGIGKEESWKNILDKKTNLKLEENYIDGEVWESFYVHRIKQLDMSKFCLDQNLLEEMKAWKKGYEVIDLNYFLSTIKLALDDSKLVYNEKDKIGLVLAHENAGVHQFLMEMFNEAFDILNKKEIRKLEFFKKIFNVGAKKANDLQTFMFLFHVAKIFNIHNFSLFINNACASGLYALEVAADIIKSKKCKAVIVAAVDHPDIYKYLWFKQLGLYSSDGKIKPFCSDSNGFSFGEGGAAMVLEDSTFALDRNAKIYAEYLGGDFCLEGWKVVFPAIAENYYSNLLKNALKKSNLRTSDIDLINPHGVGHRVLDRYEAKAITEVFGLHPVKPLITAFKPYFGHVLGGSAFLETAILLIAFAKQIVPPTLNCENIDQKMKIDLLKQKKDLVLNYALKTCSAFAGFDAAVIFKKFEKK